MQESLNAIPARVAPIETKSFARQVKIDFFSTPINTLISLLLLGLLAWQLPSFLRWSVIKFRKGWVKSFCPKLITLERYPFQGPFKTELEMRSILNSVSKANDTTS